MSILHRGRSWSIVHRSRCIMHRRRSIVNRSSLVPLLHTDLPREQDRCLLTLGVPQLCGALLQGLGLLRCEGKLEAFLLRNFITFNFRQLDRPVFTLPLWYRIANCYSSLSCVYNRYIVADLVLDSLAISLVSIPSILLLRTHLLSFFLTLSLVLHLHSGGLSLLGLLVVDVVANLIVHQLLSLCADGPHHLHTIFLGVDGARLHLDLLAVPLYGGGAHLCIQLNLLYMTLLVSQDSGMTGMNSMARCAGVNNDRDGGKRGVADHAGLRLCKGEEGEGREEEREDDSPHVVTTST